MSRATTVLQWVLVILPILIILTAVLYIAWVLIVADDPTFRPQLSTI